MFQALSHPESSLSRQYSYNKHDGRAEKPIAATEWDRTLITPVLEWVQPEN